ncbi:MFS transporter [Actinomadura craniellae]|uniref:MFS transporter n=1 Tax=Actinomadura craniellae TaxID=2231787 RepID=A0A365H6R2_9ACTN|nr:MFS transporter [Actinomadura craniellae]RAY14666.1 MFS transporter [Actinomadura craniellae]
MGDVPVRLASRTGRWVVLATVLGSGIAFLDSSVVNVALPAIGRSVGGGFSVLQWVLDGYLLTLSALLLLGGALGDRYGRRRVFAIGLVIFTLASLGCGLAPNAATLIAARLLQGVGGALLVPGSLALIDATIDRADRGRAVGMWAGLSGVAAALGPFIGGWLVDAASWRWVFYINVPLAAVALLVLLRHVPESRSRAAGRLDYPGALAATVGLGGAIYALIEVPGHGWTPINVVLTAVGAAGLLLFPVIEHRQPNPLLPPALLRSVQFVGVNLTTLAVYSALGGALFLLTLQLQVTLGYSALEAGLATLPMTVIMMTLSGRMGALAQRIGARPLMTAGPLVAGLGLALMMLARPGTGYVAGVLPGVLVFGLGMALTVAPLTSTVLASVDEGHVGAASGANNAVARLANLLAVAVLPLLAGLDMNGGGPLGDGFGRAMMISAVLCALGGVISWFTVRRTVRVRTHPLPGVNQACQDPCTRERAEQGTKRLR